MNIPFRIVLPLFIFVIIVSADQTGPEFEHLSLQQGLSQSSVYAIVQDHQGFMWFGTQDGLNKYDGYTFTTFRYDSNDSTSISHNFISALYLARDGTLWIGTNGGGVNAYDNRTGKFTRYMMDPNASSTIVSNAVLSLTEDHQGTIWAGTRDGLSSFNPVQKKWKRYYSDPINKVSLNDPACRALYADPDGTLWIGHWHGATRFSIAQQRFERINEIPYVQSVNVIKRLSDGTIWLVGNEISIYTPAKKTFAHPSKNGLLRRFFPNNCDVLFESNDGSLWIGSDGGVIRQDHSGALQIYVHKAEDEKSISENYIISGFQDRSGILWFGTFQGLNKYVPTKKQFIHKTQNPKDKNTLLGIRVRGFAEDISGALWIATQSGLNRYIISTDRYFQYSKSDHNPKTVNSSQFWTVVSDRTSNIPRLFAGSNGQGVNEIMIPPHRTASHPVVRNTFLTNRSPASLAATILSSFQDMDGAMWFGHLDGGVSRYDRHTDRYVQFRLPNSDSILFNGCSVISFLQDRKGFLWIGSFGYGLARVDFRNATVKHFQNDSKDFRSLSENSVLSMAEDRNGVLWFGTYGGLNRFDPTSETFSHFTTKNGFTNDVIYGILCDDRGNVWLSSNAGLMRFNPKTGTVRSFDVNDGLQSNEFNQGAALKTKNGRMIFGGINGFNIFHPDSIRDNPNVPTVVLSDFKIFNKSVLPGRNETRLLDNISVADAIHLSYNDAVMTIEFAALEFTQSSRNLYAYRMEGFNDEWVMSGTKREATYTNLDPGEYTFHVKASNNDGVWNEQGTSIRIVIAPPWWATLWFRGILLLMLISIGSAIYYRRVTLLKEEFVLQQKFSQRLIESQENERKRIASELHDGLGQDLLVVKNRAYIALQQKRLSIKLKDQLNHIQETATLALASVRQISRNLRPYHLERMGLNEALKFMIDGMKGSTTVKYNLEVDEIGGLLSKEQEVNIFRIVQEAVTNIIKHSQASTAVIRIHKEPEKLVLTVWDDGKGFSMEQSESVKKGFGLSGIGERVRILGALLSINSALGEGTVVRVELPVVVRNG